MINSVNFPIAYGEVLDVIKFFPKEIYTKIPKEKIEFYEKNKNKNYKSKINSKQDIKSQKLLIETKVILVSIYREYIANEKQREIIDEILQLNEKKIQNSVRIKYNPNDVFKKQEKIKQEEHRELVEITEKNILQKIYIKIINLLKVLNLIKDKNQ